MDRVTAEFISEGVSIVEKQLVAWEKLAFQDLKHAQFRCNETRCY